MTSLTEYIGYTPKTCLVEVMTMDGRRKIVVVPTDRFKELIIDRINVPGGWLEASPLPERGGHG